MGGFIVENVDFPNLKEGIKEFVEEKTGEEIFKDTSMEGLLERKGKLEEKLHELSRALLDKVEEGSDKYYEIEKSIMKTQKAIKETQKAIEALQESLMENAEAFGVGRTSE